MNVADLRAAISSYRERLKANSGKMLSSTDNGPIGMAIIEVLASAIESQQEQIDELKRKIG